MTRRQRQGSLFRRPLSLPSVSRSALCSLAPRHSRPLLGKPLPSWCPAATGVSWLANQAVGYRLLGYPTTWDSFACAGRSVSPPCLRLLRCWCCATGSGPALSQSSPASQSLFWASLVRGDCWPSVRARCVLAEGHHANPLAECAGAHWPGSVAPGCALGRPPSTAGGCSRRHLRLMAGRFPPERIVCLTEETSRPCIFLGEQDRIVGVSGYAVRPRQVRREKPRVSAFNLRRHPADLGARPRLVLTFSDLQAEIAAELIRHGVAIHALTSVTSLVFSPWCARSALS